MTFGKKNNQHLNRLNRKARRAERAVSQAMFQPLEARQLMSTVPVATGVPALSSNPSATAKLYLDFNGDAARNYDGIAVTATPAYDSDWDSTTFSDQDIANIREIWSRVAEKFSPFNIDVTTIDPGSYGDKSALKVVIGGDGQWTGGGVPGVASPNAFSLSYESNYAYVFSDNMSAYPLAVADTVAHQAGRAFGAYNVYIGSEVDQGTTGIAPTMGGSMINSQRRLWWSGHNATYNVDQDDMAIIAGSANGFGYRADDVGNTTATAAAITGTTRSAVIEQPSDVDYFSFATNGGAVTLRVDPAQYGAMLDPILELHNSSGGLIATADASYTVGKAYPGDIISTTLSAGTYYIAVKGHGSIAEMVNGSTVNGHFADVGQYTVSVTGASQSGPSAPNAPSSLTATSASSSQINLNWADNSADETGFTLDRAIDSAFTSGLVSTNLAAGTTSYSATGLSAGTTYYFRVRATNSAGSSANSNTASAATQQSAPLPPTAPSSLTASSASQSQINLAWTNVAGETGYAIEYSMNGTTWSQLTTTAADVTSFQDAGLSASTTYDFRVRAYNGSGYSGYSPMAVGTTQAAQVLPPSAPASLNATAASSSQINLSWTNVANETGYRIERSSDGVNWGQIYTTLADVTTFQDTGLAAGTKYYYRVSAYNTGGSSSPSPVANATTTATVQQSIPTAPAKISVSTPSRGKNVITWTDSSSNEAGFVLQVSTNGTWTTIATLPANTTTFTDTAVKSKQRYTYRVAAYNSAGTSAYVTSSTVRAR